MDTSIRDGGGSYQPWSEKKDGDDKDEEPVVHTFLSTAKVMAVTGPLNIFLLCMPVAMVSYWMHWASGVTFILSLLALAPLAERLGFVTEQLAMHTNETIGGLLNATFGNATELIVAITALKRGLFRLVQLSLLGSILSNMLLVLGTAFWVGGYYHKIQKFGTISSQINSTLLMIATMGILFPTILTNSAEEDNAEELGYSRGTSIVLFLLYFAFLYFQLFSHKFLYEERPEETEKLKESMMDPKLVDTHPKGSDRAFAPVNRVLSRGNSVTSQERQGSLTSTGYLSTEDAALRLHPAIEEGVDGFMAKGGSVEDEEDEEEEEEVVVPAKSKDAKSSKNNAVVKKDAVYVSKQLASAMDEIELEKDPRNYALHPLAEDSSDDEDGVDEEEVQAYWQALIANGQGPLAGQKRGAAPCAAAPRRTIKQLREIMKKK
mmetsp:Transcript_14140/g.31760  ORF Transcript_14140/g.31760 Transcript_14140/m.31760 type:complete len:434 (+) Transcript_14140:136-1437(+)